MCTHAGWHLQYFPMSRGFKNVEALRAAVGPHATVLPPRIEGEENRTPCSYDVFDAGCRTNTYAS